MRLRKLQLGLLGVFAFCLLQPAHAIFTMRIDPPASAIDVNDTVSVDLLVDATFGDAFVGFGADLLSDAALLDFDSFVFNPVFDSIATVVDSSTAGVLELTGLQNFPFTNLSGDDILLGTATFEGLAVGTSSLTFGFPDLGSTDGLIQPFPPGGVVGPDILVSGSVQVKEPPVPVPATLALTLIGLAAMMRHFRY